MAPLLTPARTGGGFLRTARALLLGAALLFAATPAHAAGRGPPRPPARAPTAVPAAPVWPVRPALVLMVVIDQLPADALPRFAASFAPPEDGGFRRFTEQGAYRPFAAFELLNCMTGPGHATIATGANPARHGIVMNRMFNRATATLVAAAADPRRPLVGADAVPGEGIAPTQLEAPTIGDAMKLAGFTTRVYGVAIKERGSVFGAGREGDLAIWFETKPRPRWVTSTWYRPDNTLPGWMNDLNAAVGAAAGTPVDWKPAAPPGGHAPEGDSAPVTVAAGSDAALETPWGLALTTDAALAAVDGAGLGRGPDPDLLFVSYSTPDLVGHEFGPRSVRYAAILRDTDRELGRLVRGLEARVGSGRLLAVLTGDHGVAPLPEAFAGVLRTPAGRLDLAGAQAAMEQALTTRFGAPPPAPAGAPGPAAWVWAIHNLHVFLNRAAVARAGLDPYEVQAAARAPLLELTGVRDVIAAAEPPHAGPREPSLVHAVAVSLHPERAGDLVIVPRPYFVPRGDNAVHLTHYPYDARVPLAFYGAGVRPGVRAEPVFITDIAPTLAFMLGIAPPALAEGRPIESAVALPGGAP